MRYRKKRNPISNSPPPPWWKRRATWIGTVLTASVTALASTWIVSVAGPHGSSSAGLPAPSSSASSSGNSPTTSGPPVRITLGNVGVIEQSYILPEPAALTAQQLNTLNRQAGSNNLSYLKWLAAHHASFDNALDFLLVVQGNRRQPVRIINMVSSETCTASLHGTLFLDYNAGAVINTRLTFNLSQPRTPASYIDPNTQQSVPDYFSKYGVTLNYGEQFSFGVLAQAVPSRTCSVVFVMTVLAGNQTIRETVNDQGQPFSVTGSQLGTGPGTLSAYGDVYIAGAFPSASGFWTRVNPKTFDPSCPPTNCGSSVLY
jgi:hypothetical protein